MKETIEIEEQIDSRKAVCPYCGHAYQVDTESYNDETGKAETPVQEPLRGPAWEAVEFEARVDDNGDLWARLVDRNRWIRQGRNSQCYWSLEGNPARVNDPESPPAWFHIVDDPRNLDYDLSVLAYLRGLNPGGDRLWRCGAPDTGWEKFLTRPKA